MSINNLTEKKDILNFNLFFSAIFGSFIKKIIDKKKNDYEIFKKTTQLNLLYFEKKGKFRKFIKEKISVQKKKDVLCSKNTFFLAESVYKKNTHFLNQNFYQIFSFFLCHMKFSCHITPLYFKKIFFERIKNKILHKEKISSRKKSRKSYSIRKFLLRTTKQQHNIGSKQKDHFISNIKFKHKEKIFNIKVIYDRLNNLLHKNSIIGFTHDSFRLLIFILEKYFINMLKKLRNIAISSQVKKKKEWGVKNLSFLRKDDGQLLEKNKNNGKQEKIFFSLIKLFRKKKKKKKENKQNKNSLSLVFSTKEVSKKKSTRKKIIDENIIKTNKTLMTLLNGILQRRIKILREATKCLCKYKPMPLKINIQDKNEKPLEFNRRPDYLFKKKNTSLDNHRKLVIDHDHCLNFLKSVRSEDYPKFFSKWFFSVTIDSNLKIQDKIG